MNFEQPKLTKIYCEPADSKFVALFLRSRKIEKTDLHLYAYARERSYKILPSEIKTLLMQGYDAYQKSGLSLADYFGKNILIAKGKRMKPHEFILQDTDFDENKTVQIYISILILKC